MDFGGTCCVIIESRKSRNDIGMSPFSFFSFLTLFSYSVAAELLGVCVYPDAPAAGLPESLLSLPIFTPDGNHPRPYSLCCCWRCPGFLYTLPFPPAELCLLRLFRPAVIYSSSLGQLLPRSSSSFSKRYEAAKLDGPKYPANGLKKRGFSLHLSRSRLFCFVLPNDGRELVTFLYYGQRRIMLDGKSFEMMMAMAFSLTISLDYDSRLYRF